MAEMTKERYVAALHRFRSRIENGLELVMWDDDTPGCKDTENSWGLCSRTVEAWPDQEDLAGTERVLDDRVYYPKSLPHGCLCPFDRNDGDILKDSPWGCFYRCMYFSPKTNPPDRQEALRLYNIRIEQHG